MNTISPAICGYCPLKKDLLSSWHFVYLSKFKVDTVSAIVHLFFSRICKYNSSDFQDFFFLHDRKIHIVASSYRYQILCCITYEVTTSKVTNSDPLSDVQWNYVVKEALYDLKFRPKYCRCNHKYCHFELGIYHKLLYVLLRTELVCNNHRKTKI